MQLTKEYFDEQLNKLATKDDFEYLKVKINNIDIRLTELVEKVDTIASRDEQNIRAIIGTQRKHEKRISRLERQIIK